jgi:hypothetical protein
LNSLDEVSLCGNWGKGREGGGRNEVRYNSFIIFDHFDWGWVEVTGLFE